jgi:hypothetical protein
MASAGSSVGASGRGVTLVVEPWRERWRVRAFNPRLGADDGRVVATYDDMDAAIRGAVDNARPMEARGFAVTVRIEEGGG